MSTGTLSTRKLKSNGFTLLELVVVLIIIGVLAAIAVPKFIDLSVQARINGFLKMRGDAISTVMSVWALAAAQGATGPTGTVAVGGQTINLKYGYPTKGSLNKIFTLPDPGQGDFSWVTVMGAWDLSGNDAVFQGYYQNQSIGTCWFGYREATATAPAAIGQLGNVDNCGTMSSGLWVPGSYTAD